MKIFRVYLKNKEMINFKKTESIIIFFLVFNYSFLNSQSISGKITFKGTIIIPNEYKKNSNKSKLIDLYKAAKDVEATLIFNKKFSFFSTVDKMDTENSTGFNFTHINAGGNNKFYTENAIMQYVSSTLDCDLLNECFLVENIMPKWELSRETKIIEGYLCYKATITNPRTKLKTIEVWYTPKIPYSYGVLEYFGLPGVILEFRRKTFMLKAVNIELEPTYIEVEKPSKKYTLLKRKEFKKMVNKAYPVFNKSKK